jgi:predicted Rossmann fold nucleotide-binding protein DprA/Smf involved in DNA uptake
VGSRHYPALERVAEYVGSLPKGSTIVTGSASGVDAEALRAARERELAVIRVAASFEEVRDPRAAAQRNQALIDKADVVAAFWDGASQGTRGTIDRALDSGKEVHVFIDKIN